MVEWFGQRLSNKQWSSKMAFGMSEATKPGANYNRDMLKPGEHICRVRDVREHSGYKGHGFFLDFEVVSGPSGEGFQSAYKCYPANARGGERMSQEQAKARELGKIQKAVAAAAGLTSDGQGEITDARYQVAIARPKSPLAGRLIIVNAISHVNQAGKDTVYYELFPYDGPDQVEVSLVTSVPAGAINATPRPAMPAVATAPTLPAPARPSFEQAMTAAGFVVHPSDPTYVHNNVDVIPVAELRARLGY